MISSIIFIILALAGFTFFTLNMLKIRSNILLGQKLDRTDNKAERWKTMILVAFGQKKMFKRWFPAVMHLFIYTAFIITQIELIEIFTDGITGGHRLFRGSLGGFYTFIISLIEILSVLAFIATIVFLSRRNLIRLPRLNMREMAGWPRKDANLILIMELTLICCIFMMNGADEVLFNRDMSHAATTFTGDNTFGFAVSQFIGPAFFGNMSNETLMIIERIGWWGHIMMVFVFLNYLPYSKHLHILLAFPNVYYSNLEPMGKFANNQAVKKEVQLMMDPDADPYAAPAPDENATPQRFGAKDVEDLSWKNLMDAYSCTECGRCTDNCPANQTGKLLSPRAIMMATRDRLEEKGNNIRKHGKDYDDGKSLHSYISEEELWACTTCNACVETCPVDISPMNIIMQMRQYLVMEESKIPNELAGMNTNIENNGAPWQFSPEDRIKWAEEE